MADFSTPFAKNAPRRLPDADERLNGFPCGPADQTLFNGLFHRIESEIGAVISHAGLTPSDSTFDQLRVAIASMISAATGDGDTEQFLLLSQAAARLPVYPEILSADGRLNVSIPATGTIRLPGGVSWIRRGVVAMTTVETDFNTVASKTYHLRWTLGAGYVLKDLADPAYNPGTLGENNPAFDSTYDDMLIARIVTNSGNLATITNLANKHDLSTAVIVEGTDLRQVGANGSNALVNHTLSWGRKPRSFTLVPARVWRSGATGADKDINFFDPALDRNVNGAMHPTSIPVTRNGLNVVYMDDDMDALPALAFSARA